MTEPEWQACADPKEMVTFVYGKKNTRKHRLFACACCRTIWPSISPVFQEAIRVAEEHADGRATDVELGIAIGAAHRIRRKRNDLERAVYDAARSSGDALGVARTVARYVAFTVAPNPSPTFVGTEEVPPNPDRLAWHAAFASHLRLESAILRDILGNPFQPITFASSWLTPKVVALGQEIYDSRTFDRMPTLADVLEEAGCDNTDILAHCREPGLHVRGCWVVDLVLGKE